VHALLLLLLLLLLLVLLLLLLLSTPLVPRPLPLSTKQPRS
jgi:hypothetical protein